MNYGFHRVIEPVGVVPQAAWKVNNDLNMLHPTEKIISVKLLNLDSTSARQIRDSDDYFENRVLEIVQERGKMHNPITNSGGVLLGEYEGRPIVPWVSLSAIPLNLIRIEDVRGQQLDVHGFAVLFESYKFSFVPIGMDWNLAAMALDIASLAVQVRRLVREKEIKKALVVGCGNAGVLAMATICKYSPTTKIFGIDVDDRNFAKIKKFGFSRKLAQVNAVNSLAVVDFVKNCDLVINCVNVPNTEAASVLAARDGGVVVFFSMATNFGQASLATDATGKDVTMIVASGVARREDEEVFRLMRDFPYLLTIVH